MGNYSDLERQLGYTFQNESLLQEAFTRTSAINERSLGAADKDFQRLEHIGDAALNLAITDILYEHYPHHKEGMLTILRSKFVNNDGPLAEIARTLKLNNFIIMGRSEIAHDITNTTKALSDAMEALIGALWLDSNKSFNILRAIVIRHWAPLGLVPTTSYRELVCACYGVDSEEEQRIQLEACFKQEVTQDTLDRVFIDIGYNYGPEIFAIFLAHHPSQFALDTVLIFTVLEENTDKVQCLLEHGANANVVYDPRDKNRSTGGFEWFSIYADDTSLSALQIAVLSCDSADIVTLLLQHGADPNWNHGLSKKEKRKTSWISALRDELDDVLGEGGLSSIMPGLDDIFPPKEVSIGELLRHTRKHQPREHTVQWVENKKAALHILFERQFFCIDIFNALLEAGADIASQDARGNMPLHLSLCQDELSVEVVTTLLESGAKPDLKNAQNQTALQVLQSSAYRFGYYPEERDAATQITGLLKEYSAAIKIQRWCRLFQAKNKDARPAESEQLSIVI